MLTSTGVLDEPCSSGVTGAWADDRYEEPLRSIDVGDDVVIVAVAAAAVATCRDKGIDVLVRCRVPMRTRSPWAAWRATADMIAGFSFWVDFSFVFLNLENV